MRPVHSHSLLPTSPLLISSSGNTHILQLWRNSVTNTHRMDSTHTHLLDKHTPIPSERMTHIFLSDSFSEFRPNSGPDTVSQIMLHQASAEFCLVLDQINFNQSNRSDMPFYIQFTHTRTSSTKRAASRLPHMNHFTYYEQ